MMTCDPHETSALSSNIQNWGSEKRFGEGHKRGSPQLLFKGTEVSQELC